MAIPNFRERFESSLEEARNPKPFDFRKELQSLLEKKHKQGMLDDRFDNLLKTQEQHLGMYLSVFCQVTGKLIADLAEHLSSPTMDYDQILYLAASLKEASDCMESFVFRAQTAQRKASEGRWLLVNRRLLVNQISVDQIKNEAKDFLEHLLGMGVIGPIFAPEYGEVLYGNRQLKYTFTQKMKRFMLKIGKLLNSLIVNLDSEILRLEDLSDSNHNVIASTAIELREVCEEIDAIGMVNHCSELWSAIQVERVEKCPDILQRLRDETDVLFQHLEVLIQYDEKIVEKEEKEEHEKKLFSCAVLAGGICLCIVYLIGHRFGRFSNLM